MRYFLLIIMIGIIVTGCNSGSGKKSAGSQTTSDTIPSQGEQTLPYIDGKRSSAEPLIAKDLTNVNEQQNRLFVFVGEKIELKRLTKNVDDFNAAAKAKYKIVQRIYGNYEKDTIEFMAYDHYGRFGFSDHRHVLLYVSEDSGNYYHEKYQYDDVYMTKSGRWAGSYSNEYSHSYNKDTRVKPEKIEFLEELSYTVDPDIEKKVNPEYYFPQPYFQRKGNRAIAVYGNYVEELFQLRKEGVLTARRLFGNEKEETP
jgi:hypothetical protein